MSKLTQSAKRIYLKLWVGNVVILMAAIGLTSYFLSELTRPHILPSAARDISKFIYRIKALPEQEWPHLLKNQRIALLELSLSATPKYPNNAFLTLSAPSIMGIMKEQHRLRISVFIKPDNWLNVTLNLHTPNRAMLITVLGVIGLGLLLALSFLNYWAVQRLNQSLQIVIESLQYAKNQESWLPIPLVGDDDQQLILQHINALQEKLGKLLYNRTHVLAAISHDLRTPLTRLKLRAEYLEDSIHFEKIKYDIADMEMMIKETLDYFSDRNQGEEKQRFDLVALLSSLCDDAKDAARDISFHSSKEKWVYLGCINLLKRAFSNAINNALHYGSSVSVWLKELPQAIEITIEDNGEGIPEDELIKVFHPFYRGEASRSRDTGGTGLGLTIAKEIVQVHEGVIRLENRSEGGLRVVIVLPMLD